MIESANRLTISGLAFLAVALGGSVLLVTDIMFDGARVWIYAGAVLLVIVVLWFVRPLARTARGASPRAPSRGRRRPADR